MTIPDPDQVRVVLVTGPSGAGRTTAIRCLEDMGFEAIDNLPLSLIEEVVAEGRSGGLALGIDARNRDFSVTAVLHLADRLEAEPSVDLDLLYLDARPDILINRYSETRRRHPLAPAAPPCDGIAREMDLLQPIRDRATMLLETSALTPHDLRDELGRLFGGDDGPGMVVSVESFSYKRGVPAGADMVFDMRFLRNPHWSAALRDRDGRDPEVARFVRADPRFADIAEKLRDLLCLLLPAFREEGKSSLTLAFGCTGGQHRSVVVTEYMANALAAKGWRVSIRHREVLRRGEGALRPSGGTQP